MIAQLRTWGPVLLLGIGAVFTVGVDAQRALPLRADLAASLPRQFQGLTASDLVISDEEQRVAGMSAYLMRLYSPAGSEKDLTKAAFSVYVGYYEQQMQGQTIHSPKNCMPGSGWEALASQVDEIDTASGPVRVNRYLLQRKNERVLVMYWYQGRGRIEANEYVVKWNLLRDAAVRRRSDEALVRIVVPITDGEEAALHLAEQVARGIVPAVNHALPL
jgi:EpsI family protein